MILTRDPEGSSPLRSAGIVAWPNANVEVRVGDLWDVIDPAPRLDACLILALAARSSGGGSVWRLAFCAMKRQTER
jgi:hypothetical protein